MIGAAFAIFAGFMFIVPATLQTPACAAPQTGANMHRVDLEHFTLWSQRELSDSDVFETRQNLQNVRREVGRAFGGYYPDKKFDVLLTEMEVFKTYSGLPDHVSGFFDGTIHLPVPSAAEPEKLKSILYHEYSHALIWQASGGHCPSWIHEGLAVDQEERVSPHRNLDVEKLVRGGRLRWRLDELDRQLDPRATEAASADLAYAESYAVIRYLRGRKAPGEILRWLRAMSQSGSWSTATRDVFKITPDQLERAVAEQLKAGR
jgi:hypothetical protein